ncbi:MAG TPA: hypothetical protein VEZ14_04725 [Dehalococcoidia bacterium]|nr:hypothetical protein [Dehalococcoidia bacterium]
MKAIARHRALLAAATVLATAAALAFAIRSATSQGGSGVVDFTKVTTVPFTGYPSTITVPDLREPTCQAPANERPAPDLPPLSCRLSSGEPPPGAIPTASPAQRPVPAAPQPAGVVVADNRLFRYTITIPSGWYSNMRPEGGTFQLTDAAATREMVDHSNPSGGIVITFGASKYVDPSVTGAFDTTEKRLQHPNASFGVVAGVIWGEGPGEGAAAIIHAAFRVGNVLFEANAGVASDGRPQEAIAADIASVRSVLQSITPY